LKGGMHKWGSRLWFVMSFSFGSFSSGTTDRRAKKMNKYVGKIKVLPINPPHPVAEL